jgi:hypothetical protein
VEFGVWISHFARNIGVASADVPKLRPNFLQVYPPVHHPASQSAANSEFSFEYRSCKNTSWTSFRVCHENEIPN